MLYVSDDRRHDDEPMENGVLHETRHGRLQCDSQNYLSGNLFWNENHIERVEDDAFDFWQMLYQYVGGAV